MMSATVQQRKDRGTWRVVVHRAGKRRVFECKTEGEARAKAAALNARQDASDGWLADGHESTERALRGWLETYRPTLSRSYEGTAKGLIEHHLVPHFGALPLRAIDEGHLLAFVDGVYRDGKSGALALNCLSLLRRVCQIHVEAGLLDRNPCARVGALDKREEE